MKKEIVILIVFAFILFSCDSKKSIKEQSFVILSDLHLGLASNDNNLQKTLLILDSLAPDHIFILGDIIKGLTPDMELAYRQWSFYMDKLGNKPNIEVIPGNHDYWDESSQSLYQQINKKFFFKKTVGDFLFIGMDVVNDQYEIQLKWLEKTLKKNNKEVILLTHYPLIEPENYESPIKINKSLKERLLSLIDEYNVEYVFSGHLHSFHRMSSIYLTQIICGSSTFDSQLGDSLIKRNFLIGTIGETLEINKYQDGNIIPIDELYNEKLNISDLFSDWKVYKSEQFGISYGLPGRVKEDQLTINEDRYEHIFKLTDRLSHLCIVIQEYNKSAKEGVEEDLAKMQYMYKSNLNLDITQLSEGPIECEWDSYKWEGILSDKRHIKMAYVLHNSKIYCFLLYSSEKGKKDNEKIFDIFWNTVLLN